MVCVSSKGSDSFTRSAVQREKNLSVHSNIYAELADTFRRMIFHLEINLLQITHAVRLLALVLRGL